MKKILVVIFFCSMVSSGFLYGYEFFQLPEPDFSCDVPYVYIPDIEIPDTSLHLADYKGTAFTLVILTTVCIFLYLYGKEGWGMTKNFFSAVRKTGKNVLFMASNIADLHDFQFGKEINSNYVPSVKAAERHGKSKKKYKNNQPVIGFIAMGPQGHNPNQGPCVNVAFDFVVTSLHNFIQNPQGENGEQVDEITQDMLRRKLETIFTVPQVDGAPPNNYNPFGNIPEETKAGLVLPQPANAEVNHGLNLNLNQEGDGHGK